MVEIIDDSNRLRNETYRHINELLHPNFHLRSAGTGADIYQGSCPRIKVLCKNNKQEIIHDLVGQWDSERGYPVGNMFLYWDNVQIFIKGSPQMFMPIAMRLEEHSYRVTIEV